MSDAVLIREGNTRQIFKCPRVRTEFGSPLLHDTRTVNPRQRNVTNLLPIPAVMVTNVVRSIVEGIRETKPLRVGWKCHYLVGVTTNDSVSGMIFSDISFTSIHLSWNNWKEDCQMAGQY